MDAPVTVLKQHVEESFCIFLFFSSFSILWAYFLLFMNTAIQLSVTQLRIASNNATN